MDRAPLENPRIDRGGRTVAGSLGLAMTFFFVNGRGMANEEKGGRERDHDVVLSFEGVLFDLDAERVALKLRFDLPAYEWLDKDGRWNFETGSGAGIVEVFGDGRLDHRVPMTVRLSRFPTDGPFSKDEQGRVWALRGDIYLKPDDHALIDMEFAGQARIPNPGVDFAPPLPERARGEGARAYAVRAVDTLMTSGAGGGVLHGGHAPLWNRPSPVNAYFGYVHLTKSSAILTRRSETERDADRLISRIQYVRADYPLAVENGAILNEAEYGEQIRLLQEARLLAERLPLAPEALRGLEDLRNLIEWKRSPDEVARACTLLTQDLIRALWLSMTPPEPGPASLVPDVFQESCVPCHGERGDGQTPKALELDPPPATFASAEFVSQLSPYRAYNAVTWGIAGTAMPAFIEGLSPGDRWSLAFHVFSFFHAPRAAGGRELMEQAGIGAPALEELALMTDDALATWLAARLRASEVPIVLAYLRTEGVGRAKASALRRVRAHVREVAQGHPTDQGRAKRASEEALSSYRDPEGSLRIRDRAAADRIEAFLHQLRRATEDEDSKAVQNVAYTSIVALSEAEQLLAKRPPHGFAAVRAVLEATLPFCVAAVLVLALLWISAPRATLFGVAVGTASGLVLGRVMSGIVFTPYVLLAPLFVALFVLKRRFQTKGLSRLLTLAAVLAAWLGTMVPAASLPRRLWPWLTDPGADQGAVRLGLAFAACILALIAMALVTLRRRKISGAL